MTERASGRCYANLDAIPGERFIKCAYHKAGGKPRNPCGPKDAGRAVAECLTCKPAFDGERVLADASCFYWDHDVRTVAGEKR